MNLQTRINDSQSIDASFEAVEARRKKFLAPSLKTFTAFTEPLNIVEGRGQYIFDQDGKKYLDCLSQNLTISVGYNNQTVLAAVTEQYGRIEHVTTMFYNPIPGHLAEELIATLPDENDWVIHFVNSGAEAIDLAVLLARVYTQNNDVICLRDCYHGLHFTAMSATGMQACRQPVMAAPGFLHVAAPNQFRGIFGKGTEPYVAEVGNTIKSSTPGQIAAIMLEPIQGYTGVIPLPQDYVKGAVDIARVAGGLYIADEVQTGFGRTGDHFWGFEYHGVVPDMVVMGKGIANGFPVSAVAIRRDVAESMAKRKFFNTFGSNPVGCAAARAVLHVLRNENMQENARKVGGMMKAGLEKLAETHEIIGDVRGRGLMMGVEIVKDRETMTPGTEEATKLHDTAKSMGLLIGRAGPHGSVMRVCPPLCISEDDVSFFLETFENALPR